MLILRRPNCIGTASGIVTLFRWLFSTQIKKGFCFCSFYRLIRLHKPLSFSLSQQATPLALDPEVLQPVADLKNWNRLLCTIVSMDHLVSTACHSVCPTHLFNVFPHTSVAATDQVAAALPCGRVGCSAHEHYAGRRYACFSRRGNQNVNEVAMKVGGGRTNYRGPIGPEGVPICYVCFSFSR